jgi:hypothetical protein
LQTVLDAALAYARKGLRVIPIAPRSKFPRGIDGWQDLATTNPDTITDWWTNTWPQHGVGIATGIQDDGSFFFVLDVDDRDTHSGSATLANLETVHGKLPDTLTCRTGTGGRHYYFTSTTAVHNDAGRRLGPGLDIRGVGGQVLAPPTIHPNGNPYTWEHNRPIAAAPQWLEFLLTFEPTKTQIDSHRTDDILTSGDRPSERFNATHNWHNLLTMDGWTWSHQEKNADYWVRPGKNPRDGISATTNWNGLDLLIIFSTNAPLPVGGYSKFGYWAYVKHNGDWKKATADFLGRNPTPAPAATPTTPDELKKIFIDWPDFWKAGYSNDEAWIAEPLIAKGRQTALFAQAKQGKSLFVLSVVAALATGRPCLGRPAQPPINVIYLDYEMTPQDLNERLTDMGYDHDTDMSKLHYVLIPNFATLDTAEGANMVAELVELTGAQLVVIDTMGRAVAGEENSADTYRDYARHTGLKLKKMGVAVVRTDHAGKSIAKGQRGSSAKNDDSELVYELRQDKDFLHLKTTHSRVSWTKPNYTFRKVDDPILQFQPVEPRAEEVTLDFAQMAIYANLVRLEINPKLSINNARTAYRGHGIKCSNNNFDLAWAKYKSKDVLEAAAVAAQTIGTPAAQSTDRAAAQPPDATAQPRHKVGTSAAQDDAHTAAHPTLVEGGCDASAEVGTTPEDFFH